MGTIMGKCCKCGCDIECSDDYDKKWVLDSACWGRVDSKGKWHIYGEYGSHVFDMEDGIVEDKELIRAMRNQRRPIICDGCVQKMLDDGTLKKQTPYYNDEDKFDCEELYSLWHTCFKFLLPRLKAFKEWCGDYPSSLESNEQWKEVLDEMIWFVETSLRNTGFAPIGEEERYKKAKVLFHKHFFNLWG